MKKVNSLRGLIDITIKIVFSFAIVFCIYLVSKKVDNFAFSYFVFPFASYIIIFICGVNVGRSLEKIKNNESIGIFTKKKKNDNQVTEFKINERIIAYTDKKIIKQLENGDRVHVKAKNYDEIDDYNKDNNY